MQTLIAYFSWSGHTVKIAKKIAAETSADLFRIERQVPYSQDYETCAYKEAKEEIDQKVRPEIKTPLPDIQKYDNIIVVFPIWWYTSPLPVWKFLESYPDWKGKKIYLFANSYTDDYTYMENALKDARSSVKNAKVEAGLFNQEIEKLDEWLIERHLK